MPKDRARAVPFERQVLDELGRVSRRLGVRMTSTRRTDAWERLAYALALEAARGARFDAGPHGLIVTAVKARPRSLRADTDGRVWAPVMPDWDNVGKAACDALQRSDFGHHVLLDDRLIASGHVDTVYAAVGEQPHVVIDLFPLSGNP